MSADIPAAFLPPPKRERKHFTDEALFEAPAERGQLDDYRRRQELAAEAWPNGHPHQRREWAAAVSCLLVGYPGRSRPAEWGPPPKRLRHLKAL